MEGDGQEERKGGRRAKARKDADEGPQQCPEKAEQEIDRLKGNREAHQKTMDRLHRALENENALRKLGIQ